MLASTLLSFQQSGEKYSFPPISPSQIFQGLVKRFIIIKYCIGLWYWALCCFVRSGLGAGGLN